MHGLIKYYVADFRSWLAFPLLILPLILASIPATKTNHSPISYSQYCNHFVPESSPSPTPLTHPVVLSIRLSTFTYTSRKVETTRSRVHFFSDFVFRSTKAYEAHDDGVLKFDGSVMIPDFQYQGRPGSSTLTRRGLRIVLHLHPRIRWAIFSLWLTFS